MTNFGISVLGVFDAAPIVEEAPQPSKVFLKLELLDSVFPKAKSMQRMLAESAPVRAKMLIFANIYLP